MSKKVILQIKVLERFTIRNRKADESEKDYNAYLSRKEHERERLIRAKGSYHGSF